jgi:O-antigen/teichoic acid export membrane protein
MLFNAIVRFFPEEEELKNEIYLFSILNTLAISIIIAFSLAANANFLSMVFFKNLDFSTLLVAGSSLTILSSTQKMIASYFRARDNIKVSSSIETILSVVEVLSISLTLAFTKDLVLAVVIFVASSFLIEIVIATKVIKFFALRSILSKAVLLRYCQYVKYSLPLVPGSLMESFASNGDRFIIAYFLGAKLVGIYSIAYALGSSIMTLCVPIVYSLFPKVSRLWADGNKREARAIIRKSTKLFIASGVIFFVINLLFGNYLLLALAGKESDILENNGLIVSLIVMIGVWFYGLVKIQSLYLLALQSTKLIFFIDSSSCILNIILNIILTLRLGIFGAALATLITYIAELLIVNYCINLKKQEILTSAK